MKTENTSTRLKILKILYNFSKILFYSGIGAFIILLEKYFFGLTSYSKSLAEILDVGLVIVGSLLFFIGIFYLPIALATILIMKYKQKKVVYDILNVLIFIFAITYMPILLIILPVILLFIISKQNIQNTFNQYVRINLIWLIILMVSGVLVLGISLFLMDTSNSIKVINKTNRTITDIKIKEDYGYSEFFSVSEMKPHEARKIDIGSVVFWRNDNYYDLQYKINGKEKHKRINADLGITIVYLE